MTRVVGWIGGTVVDDKTGEPVTRIENHGEGCVVSELGNGVRKFGTEGGQGVVDRVDGVLESSLKSWVADVTL